MINVVYSIIIILILIIFLIVIDKKKENFDTNCALYTSVKENMNQEDKKKPYPNPMKYPLLSLGEQLEEDIKSNGPSETKTTECMICEPGEFITSEGCKKCPLNEISTQKNEWECTPCAEDEMTCDVGSTKCVKKNNSGC